MRLLLLSVVNHFAGIKHFAAITTKGLFRATRSQAVRLVYDPHPHLLGTGDCSTGGTDGQIESWGLARSDSCKVEKHMSRCLGIGTSYVSLVTLLYSRSSQITFMLFICFKLLEAKLRRLISVKQMERVQRNFGSIGISTCRL